MIDPLWQMAVRQKLSLFPGDNEPISALLFAALYSSASVEEFEQRVETHISDLRKALEVLKSV